MLRAPTPAALTSLSGSARATTRGADAVASASEIFDLAFAPNASVWELGADGEWTHHAGSAHLQETLITRRRMRRTGA